MEKSLSGKKIAILVGIFVIVLFFILSWFDEEDEDDFYDID